MFYALAWLGVFALFAIWTLAAWGFDSIATWTAANASSMVGSAPGPLPEWLSAWLPPAFSAALTSIATTAAPVFETMLAWAPSVAGGLSVLIWVVWGLGSALLLMLGLALSGIIAAVRWRLAGKATRSGSTTAPGGSLRWLKL